MIVYLCFFLMRGSRGEESRDRRDNDEGNMQREGIRFEEEVQSSKENQKLKELSTTKDFTRNV